MDIRNIDWEIEEVSTEEFDKLSAELLAACGLGCGGHEVK